MTTSRSALEWLLDPDNLSVTLLTLEQPASVLSKKKIPSPSLAKRQGDRLEAKTKISASETQSIARRVGKCCAVHR
jgi:hypothetical protein